MAAPQAATAPQGPWATPPRGLRQVPASSPTARPPPYPGRRLPAAGRRRLLNQLVAHAPYGLDPGLAAADLVAHPGHVHVDGSRVAVIVIAPGELEQPLALVDDARVARQRGQQVKLLRPQLDQLARNPD